jgi:hypothetical protein
MFCVGFGIRIYLLSTVDCNVDRVSKLMFSVDYGIRIYLFE